MTKIQTYNCNQIGGCVVTIETEKSKIVIDFGENLPGSKSDNMDIEGLTYGKADCDGVFFTHYHGDHIGRMQVILPEVPLYMGAFTKQVLLNINDTIKNDVNVQLLKDFGRVHVLMQNEPVIINDGDIIVTPYSVDHSAYEAFMFLIQTPDKTILHTGDFRGHGYRGKKGLIPTIKHYIRDNGRRDIDILITEGTMLNRQNQGLISEWQLHKWAEEFFKKHRHVFLICSSTNFDSLASFYHAAKSNGMNMYGNRYVVRQLRTITEYTKQYGDLYQFNNVYTADFEKYLISKNGWSGKQNDLMEKFGFVCIIKGTKEYEKWIEEYSDLNPVVIYSMWEGYINPESEAYNSELAQFCKKYNAICKHTSGHASVDVIEEVINAVAPKEAIIPIHTENTAGILELNISEELKRRVRASE